MWGLFSCEILSDVSLKLVVDVSGQHICPILKDQTDCTDAVPKCRQPTTKLHRATSRRDKALERKKRHFYQAVICQESFCSILLVTETATRSRWCSGYNCFFLFRRTCVQIPPRRPTNHVFSVSFSQIPRTPLP